MRRRQYMAVPIGPTVPTHAAAVDAARRLCAKGQTYAVVLVLSSVGVQVETHLPDPPVSDDEVPV